MAITTLLWIASLATSGAPAPAGTGDVPLRAHVLEMEGIQWRADLLDGLRYVGQEGGSTIWTADAATLRRLIAASAGCQTAGTAKGLAAGKGRTKYVASLQRIAQVSGGKVTALAYKPTIGEVPDGVEIEATGRREGGGVLADLAIKDSHLITIHTSVRSESIHSGSGSTTLNASFQVPEVSEKRSAGRWLIPNGGAVVVGLGIDTVRDAGSSRAVRRERVVVVDAGDVAASAFAPPISVPTPAWRRHLERAARPVALTALFTALLGAGAIAGWFVRGHGERRRVGVALAPASPAPVADAAGMLPRGQAPGRGRRSPTVVQLMVLVGASAVACWAVQAVDATKTPIDMCKEAVVAIAEGKTFREVVAAIGMLLAFVAAPLLASWSATLALMALQQPWVAWRRLRDRPGIMACFQVGLVVAAVAAAGLGFSLAMGHQDVIEICVVVMAILSGLAVVACWVTMSLLRAWRPEPTWVDRLGLLLGTAWVITLPFTLTWIFTEF